MLNPPSIPLSPEEMLGLTKKVINAHALPTAAAHFSSGGTTAAGTTGVAGVPSYSPASRLTTGSSKPLITNTELIIIAGGLILIVAGVQYMKWQERKLEEKHYK